MFLAFPPQSSGAPNVCFLWNICSEKQMLPRIFYYLRTPKQTRWSFHSCTIFETYLINSLQFSEVKFSHVTSQVRLFFLEKRKPKIFGLKKCNGERNQKMSHFRDTSNCISNFRENNTQDNAISKRLNASSSGMTEQIQTLYRHLECISGHLCARWRKILGERYAFWGRSETCCVLVAILMICEPLVNQWNLVQSFRSWTIWSVVTFRYKKNIRARES